MKDSIKYEKCNTKTGFCEICCETTENILERNEID